MRELKFRAYDKRFNVMLTDIMPYQPSIVLSDVTFNDCYGDKADDRSEIGVDDGGPEHYCITDDQIEIMQYTGLIGSYKKEVYEYDIVTIEDNDGERLPQYIIEWDENVFNFIGRCVDGLDWMMLEEFEGCIVIGNVYQNTELL